ncbi:peroxidase 25 [Olea europaea subsp. europaea]|uniref:Peroxidase n=1 Tax=Olea europaea subsp. europaea TaxID=158383 RepID=A0A8S0RIC9_OLEEU|nr:peroxidase 25 [Olea europaea subsp. europaea]
MGNYYFKQMSIALFFLLAVPATVVLGQGTRVGFYSRSCPRAESIVQSAVRSGFNSNPTVAPGLLRMHFHDCFVQGCDGSILINGDDAEKMAGPNRLLRGYEVIDDAKTQLEAACPGVVSCADILALAARDAVLLHCSQFLMINSSDRTCCMMRQYYELSHPMLRIFRALHIPLTFKNRSLQKNISMLKILSPLSFFRYILYNFNSITGSDPSIDSAFLPQLRLDDGSENRFDNSFFTNLRNGWGILESDQTLWIDDSTKTFVQRFLGIRGLLGLTFSAEFGKSMVKMSNIEVKTGTNGEIRKVCSAIN